MDPIPKWVRSYKHLVGLYLDSGSRTYCHLGKVLSRRCGMAQGGCLTRPVATLVPYLSHLLYSVIPRGLFSDTTTRVWWYQFLHSLCADRPHIAL
jgi:hypothetical protein